MNLSTTGLRIKADSAVDLHLHTNYSDGRWTLDTLIDHLCHEQFELAAIADHDRADTVPAIQQLSLEKHLPVLAAVEMSSEWKGELVDLLCYRFDPKLDALNDLTQDLLRRQKENMREVYDNLQRQGYVFSYDALPAILSKPGLEQPFALVDILKEHGYGLGDPSAEKLVMKAGYRYETNEPAKIVDAAHQGGAVCLLAHPGRGDGFMLYDTELLDQFRQETSIDGLEVYYPLHTPAQTEMYQKYAQHHCLLISAGSDSHRPDKPPIKYRAELVRGLLERVGIQVV